MSAGVVVLDTAFPFLYPCLLRTTCRKPRTLQTAFGALHQCRRLHQSQSCQQPEIIDASSAPENHLNPSPASYSQHPFTDKCIVQLHAGSGGHGCVSFLREKYIENGPANGGDGGSGGNIYIQAVRGETSLHKLARRSILKAGNGANGKGKGQGGERGDDVLFTVPVGTVVREIERLDPVEEEERVEKQMRAALRRRRNRGNGQDLAENEEEDESMAAWTDYKRRKWISYPGATTRELQTAEIPRFPKERRSQMRAIQPTAPIRLDLDTPMEQPMLLAAGAVGGVGNAHFTTPDLSRPKYATKGEQGMKLRLQLELKMLADVGLVGLPNAGKSTLLRALSNSKTRVGNWAFTTLQPSIGTVILDNNRGRPSVRAWEKSGQPRTSFTIADIPGLIQDAHLDKGLGLGFLRHIERAAMLIFVVDLSAGDAVETLKALWKEVGEYENFRSQEINAETETRMAEDRLEGLAAEPLSSPPPPITSKPWLVVATKADLPDTQANFAGLSTFIDLLRNGKVPHPSGKENAWKKEALALPISAINAHGVSQLPQIIVDLLG